MSYLLYGEGGVPVNEETTVAERPTAYSYSDSIEKAIERAKQVLLAKKNEYATADHFHNFRVAAALQGKPMKEALSGMMAKHTVSVYDMCCSGKTYPMEMWDEKITDHINYLLILRALIDMEGDNV